MYFYRDYRIYATAYPKRRFDYSFSGFRNYAELGTDCHASVVGGFQQYDSGRVDYRTDKVLALGGTMLLSLVQGIEQQLPGLIPVGLSAIQNLCNSLMQNAPTMIQSGINIALQLIDGLIDALPTILTTGITLVIYLAQGLVDAIPDLIQAVPRLISAIVETLMSINWLEVGA